MHMALFECEMGLSQHKSPKSFTSLLQSYRGIPCELSALLQSYRGIPCGLLQSYIGIPCGLAVPLQSQCALY